MKRRDYFQTAAAGAAAFVTRPTANGQEAAETSNDATSGSPEDSAKPPAGTLPQITYRRTVPVRYEADVAVIGGGIAGVSAACAAV